MKKSTEELILSEIIKLNTQVLKTNSEIGYIKEDIKHIHAKLEEHDERFDALEEKVDKGFAMVRNDIERIDYMLNEASDRHQDHERRLVALENAA